MTEALNTFIKLVSNAVPNAKILVDEPDSKDGSYWIDVRSGQRHFTLQLRPGKGFGLFHANAGYGEGPAEIYKTPKLAARRMIGLLPVTAAKPQGLDLKQLRELYEQTQSGLAVKAGVKQPAISRLEQRGEEVKVTTLANIIEKLGGKLELRACFKDAEFPIVVKEATH